MAQDELRNKSTGIIQNELIMQWEDYDSLSLNLLARINYQKDNGLLIYLTLAGITVWCCEHMETLHCVAC